MKFHYNAINNMIFFCMTCHQYCDITSVKHHNELKLLHDHSKYLTPEF